MKKTHRISGMLILAGIAVAQAQLFSPANRFSLSYSYSDSLRSAVVMGRTCFLSRPSDWNLPLPLSGLSMSDDDRRAEARLRAVAGGSSVGRDAAGFGAFNGVFTLHSAHLDGFVDLNWYTADMIAEEFPAEVVYERFIVGSEIPIDGMFDFRFGLKEAYLTFKMKQLNVDIGKRKVRWGPGYKGTLALSGTTFAPFYFYHMNYGFGDLVRLSSFLCGYDDEARFKSELVLVDSLKVAATGQNISSLPPRYGAGQRIDVRVGSHVQIGLFELVDFFGTNELNRFANPLAFYYAGNTASGTNNANMLGGADINVIVSPWRWYAEFLNDDLTVFEQAGNPDKYGWQTGVQYFPSRLIAHAGIEYTHVSRYVYGHSRVLNRHTLWNESLGWPWGNYQDNVSMYSIFNKYRNIRIKSEVNFWLSGRGRLTDEWYVDGRPDLDNAPYWPENPDRIVSGSLTLEYRPLDWCFLNVCFSPVWREFMFENRISGIISVGFPRNH